MVELEFVSGQAGKLPKKFSTEGREGQRDMKGPGLEDRRPVEGR